MDGSRREIRSLFYLPASELVLLSVPPAIITAAMISLFMSLCATNARVSNVG